MEYINKDIPFEAVRCVVRGAAPQVELELEIPISSFQTSFLNNNRPEMLMTHNDCATLPETSYLY